MTTVTAQSGDSISKLAQQYGLTWQAVWNDPNNAALRTLREKPSILWPGDKVFIRQAEPGQSMAATEQRHKFRLKDVYQPFGIAVLSQGKARVNAAYHFTINGAIYQRQLDNKGQLEHEISTLATKGQLMVTAVKAGQQQFEYELNFVSAIPANTTTGVRKRLANLGYVK